MNSDTNEFQARNAEARAFAAAGRNAEAESAWRRLLADLPGNNEPSSVRVEALKGLVRILEIKGPSARLYRVFKDYAEAIRAARDPEFDRMYLEGCFATQTSTLPFARRERFLRLTRLLDSVRGLIGDIAECGCFRGLSALLMCRAVRRVDPAFDGRGMRIFDSFAGLSEPSAADDRPEDWTGRDNYAAHLAKGNFSASLETVRRNMASFPEVEYLAGWIPAAFPAQSERTYRFVHVDVDLYQPTLDSLRYFFPRLVSGGVIVCDDFGYWPGARRAVMEFSAREKIPIDQTEAGQAYFVAA